MVEFGSFSLLVREIQQTSGLQFLLKQPFYCVPLRYKVKFSASWQLRSRGRIRWAGKLLYQQFKQLRRDFAEVHFCLTLELAACHRVSSILFSCSHLDFNSTTVARSQICISAKYRKWYILQTAFICWKNYLEEIVKEFLDPMQSSRYWGRTRGFPTIPFTDTKEKKNAKK